MPITQINSFDATQLTPLGFTTIAGTGAAQGLGTIPDNARVAIIQGYGGALATRRIVWRDDGTAPTAADNGGLAIHIDETIQYIGDLSAFQWIETGMTGIAVAFYS